MSSQAPANPIIWRLIDGKAGHVNQSAGLIQALNKRLACTVFDIQTAGNFQCFSWFSRKLFPPGKKLPSPDLIIGAGSKTQLHMLTAQRARGGKTVLLMKPEWFYSLFDLCLVPEHDHPPTRINILPTIGPLNCIRHSDRLNPTNGLMLIGGPSRHFNWDNDRLLKQIQSIIETTPGIQWYISDSRRTPPNTSASIKKLVAENVYYYSCVETDKNWVAKQLGMASRVWVTRDSVSMVFEALTAGAVVGLIDVPVKRKNKISIYFDSLIARGFLHSYKNYDNTENANSQRLQINEADRCAQEVIHRFLMS